MGILDVPSYSRKDADARFAAQKPVLTPQPQIGATQVPSGRSILYQRGNVLITWSTFGISQSSDGGQTFTAKTLPSGVATSAASGGLASIIEHNGSWYMQCLSSSGVASLFRTPIVNQATDFTWTSALKTAGAGATVISTGLASNGTRLFWGEYGDPAGGPKLYVSDDSGATWTTVNFAGWFVRHVHGIFVDPDDPNHVWVSGGDSGSTAFHVRSTDGGSSWAPAPGALGSNQAWQAVQVSFDANYLYFAPDTTANWDVFRADRETLTPRWHGRQSHRHLPVPGGLPPRRVTDLVTTAGSAAVTSATAAFTAQDVGSRIRTIGQNFVPIDSYIATVSSATAAALYPSKSSPQSTAAAVAILGGEAWGAMAYYGAVDPATGVYYFVTINGAAGGNVDGLFAVMPDGHTVLLDILTTSPDGRVVIDPIGGRVIVRAFSRPLLSV